MISLDSTMEAFMQMASRGSSVEQFAKEVHIKAQLTSRINGAVRALQHEYVIDSGFMNHAPGIPIILAETSSPAVVDLCNYLEASLLHGLKEKLSLSRVTTAVLGPKSPPNDVNCQLDYWSVILILCHNQVSESLMKLSNITTDTGRCRAWLRQTLNDGLFPSYLEALTNDTSLLHGFYRSSAYIRDREHMGLLKSILEGLDPMKFQLNYDCSSLNSWSVETLKSLGIVVQIVAEPVMPGVDALDEVRKLEIKKSRQKRRQREKSILKSVLTANSENASVASSVSSEPSFDQMTINDTNQSMRSREDGQKRQLKLFIPNPVPTPDIVITPTGTPPTASTPQLSEYTDDKSTRASVSSVSGNSISIRKQGWSSSPPSRSRNIDSHRQLEASYEAVLNSYSTEVVLSSTPDLRELNSPRHMPRMTALKDRSSNMFSEPRRQSKPKPKIEAKLSLDDFEVVPKSIVLNNAEPETHNFLMQYCKLGNEVGLDQQDYKCNSCGRPIGMIYGKSRYAMAKRNKIFLSLTETEPLLDIKVSCPILYKNIRELQNCLQLRTQLFYLHAYIFTCAESVTLELRKILWPKEHLFEHIHLYSVQDLIQLNGGQLSSSIMKAIAFARKHVLNCQLCSQKGFICELCRDEAIIYPFDTDTNYRCDTCKAVFHKKCMFDEKEQGRRKLVQGAFESGSERKLNVPLKLSNYRGDHYHNCRLIVRMISCKCQSDFSAPCVL
ncbi:Pleckstrin homology domain-containing family M member 3 [Halotydeus destructor]|nr:Pleckstrin homology domain-containing family M member 3 [Halotydeus destructor]